MEILELLLNNTVITILLFGAVIYAAIASSNVKSTFAKYNRMYVSSKVPACDAARQILDMNGLYDVQVIKIAGNLTDHYDPKKKIIALSETVYGSASVGAIGVAAHECGHAVQHATGYLPIQLRTIFVPVVNICSNAWVWIFMIGCAFGNLFMAEVGIVFFAVVVLFQLITLPVEFNASNRAVDTLIKTGLLFGEEVKGARKVLNAAAMTYVSSLLISLLQLLRLIAKVSNGKRR